MTPKFLEARNPLTTMSPSELINTTFSKLTNHILHMPVARALPGKAERGLFPVVSS